MVHYPGIMEAANNSDRQLCFWAFGLTLLAYGLSAGRLLAIQSTTPHYVLLADSFLHGRVELISLPSVIYDLIGFDDRWYVAGEIVPAVLLMPFVSVFGTSVSDIAFGVVIGAINAAVMLSLLQRLGSDRRTSIWLTILFVLGTPHWYVSTIGGVWMNAHVTAVLFMLLYGRASIGSSPIQAGIFLGLAALTRPTTMFAVLFFPALSAVSRTKLSTRFRDILSFLAPFIGCLGVMLIYNVIRFGAPFEFGYKFVHGESIMTRAYKLDGGFSPRYLACNIYVSLFGLPNLPGISLPINSYFCGHLTELAQQFYGTSSFFNPVGMSIFFATPALALIFRPRLADRYAFAAWAGLLPTLGVLWMYHSAGWVQFGYRYSLDIIVFLFILLSRGVREIRALEQILIVASVVMGAIGEVLMRYNQFNWTW